jgi:hypothetical protein
VCVCSSTNQKHAINSKAYKMHCRILQHTSHLVHLLCFFFFFKQPTTPTNYPNLFCYKTLLVSGIFSAHHQEFSTVHSHW